MGGARDSQQAFAAGEDQIDAQRERMRTLGQFFNNAFRQLRGDHPLFGDPRAGQPQHSAAAQAGKLDHQRDAGFRGDDGSGGKHVKLLGADGVAGDGEDRLLRLLNQRRAGMKAQILADGSLCSAGASQTGVS